MQEERSGNSMSLIDRLAIRAAFAANPSLRQAISDWMEHVSGEPITVEERSNLERSLETTIRLSEATKFAKLSTTPRLPARLPQDLMVTVFSIIKRMDQPSRDIALSRVQTAIRSGRLQVTA